MADAAAPGEHRRCTLPVGLDLTGRRALVVGGGPGVVSSVHALVGAGAAVHVMAPWLCEDLEELAVSGEVDWSAREYADTSDLAGAWFVVVGSGDLATDDRVRDAALEARVWCLDAVLPSGWHGAPTQRHVGHHRRRHGHAGHPLPRRPGLARDVTRAAEGLLAGGSLDLRRPRRPSRPGLGGAGRWRARIRRAAHQPRPRPARERRRRRGRPAGPTRRGRAASRHGACRRRRQGPGPARPVAGADQRPDRRRGPRGSRRRAAQGRRPLRARARRRGAACVRGARHPGRGRARRDERGGRAGCGGHPRHPPRRRSRVHRRDGARRAAGSATGHRPHRGAARWASGASSARRTLC